MATFKIFGRKKRRKYPVKVDEQGRSARNRCFEMFAEKVPLDEIAKKVGVKVDTVRRYHQQWKKDPGLERRYAYVYSLFKKTAPDRDKNIELFARVWGIEKERLETILSQPHGLRRLMTGKFYFPAHAYADHKRHVILELALLISDHIIKHSGEFVDFYLALKRYMQENMKFREEEDADIQEENKTMALYHKILAVDMENERKGRIKPDTFSEEERNAIIRLGEKFEMKKVEIWYWYRIGSLMAEGLTTEQAREKVYQYLIEKGDLKGAKALRAFQDRVHPLKTNDQIPPLSPPQPPSPL
jgi:hypothetical protein